MPAQPPPPAPDPPPPPPPTSAIPDTLVYTFAGPAPSLDPNGGSQSDIRAFTAYHSCLDYLTDFFWPVDFEEAKAALAVGELELVRPQLAESWEVSEDGLTWTFNLRKGVRSTAGNEFTSADVLWAFQRAFAIPGTGAFINSFIGGLPSAEGVTAVDTYTVTFTLPAPQPRLLLAVGFPGGGATIMMDSGAISEHATADDPWAQEFTNTNCIGHGPYELADFGAGGEELTYTARFDYWDTEHPPVGSTVVQRSVPESSSRLQLLLTGEAHYAAELGPLQLDQVDAAEGVVNTHIDNTTTLFLPMTQAPPWNDIKIRQAIAKAIPYQEILDTVLRGRGKPYDSILLPFVAGYTGEFAYETDPAAAAAVLGGVDTPLILAYEEGKTIDEQTAILVQAALQEAGLDVSLEKQPTNIFAARRFPGENEFFVDNLATPGVAAADYYFGLYGSSVGVFNFHRWSNAEFDAIAPTANVNAEHAREGQRIFMKHLPFIPVAWNGQDHPHSDFLRIPFGHVANGTFFWKDFRPA
ncbi:MAG: ABC transporter substrate-binding protein [Actinomycetia bacterium]|nr:ABC transporter substrate-binding protein [Actinomycetes bacterium]